ncbi:hypothetical protein NL676_018073 [Syzygium grande]|nr:hypothetical protein NL676_018073 [Syzygium grande]
MARIFGVDQTRANTNKIVGTFGYLSPEYAMRGQISEKSDVYSFGVLILEIISGKKNSYFFQSDGDENLASFAWKNWRAGTPLEFKIIKPHLCLSLSTSAVAHTALASLSCLATIGNHFPVALAHLSTSSPFYHKWSRAVIFSVELRKQRRKI